MSCVGPPGPVRVTVAGRRAAAQAGSMITAIHAGLRWRPRAPRALFRTAGLAACRRAGRMADLQDRYPNSGAPVGLEYTIGTVSRPRMPRAARSGTAFRSGPYGRCGSIPASCRPAVADPADLAAQHPGDLRRSPSRPYRRYMETPGARHGFRPTRTFGYLAGICEGMSSGRQRVRPTIPGSTAPGRRKNR